MVGVNCEIKAIFEAPRFPELSPIVLQLKSQDTHGRAAAAANCSLHQGRAPQALVFPICGRAGGAPRRPSVSPLPAPTYQG